MADIRTEEHYYTKDFGTYSNKEDNFVATQELTVNITLNEYRNLLKENARADKRIEDETSAKWDAVRKSEELEKEIEELRKKIYFLQNPEDIEEQEEKEWD